MTDVYDVIDDWEISCDTGDVERAAAIAAFNVIDSGAMFIDDQSLNSSSSTNKTVQAEIWSESLCYLDVEKITSFSSDLIVSNLSDWVSEAKKGVILDLRDASGTDLSAVDLIAGIFIPDGEELYSVVSMHASYMTTHTAIVSDVTCQMPLVVLINNSTRNAAELLAAVLKDKRKAMLMGAVSRGDARVRKKIALSADESLYLAHATIISASGNSYDTEGVVPDIIIPSDENDSPTPVLRDFTGTEKEHSEKSLMDRELMMRVHNDLYLQRATDLLLGLIALGEVHVRSQQKFDMPVSLIEERYRDSGKPEADFLMGDDDLLPEEKDDFLPEDK